MTKLTWKKWTPHLGYDQTLKMHMDSLPGNASSEISWMVKLLENPESPVALPGAISLERHDAIHIIIGRGLLPQDEAAVIGFTMGTCDNLNKLHLLIFKFAVRFIYPKVYQFDKELLKVFDLWVEAGKRSKCKEINNYLFENNTLKTIDDIRQELGITNELLEEYYAKEKELAPNTTASKRLA